MTVNQNLKKLKAFSDRPDGLPKLFSHVIQT